MSQKKIKKYDQLKEINKKIKESFNNIKDSISSGKINPVRSLSSLIHCAYDEHPKVVMISALSPGNKLGFEIVPYVCFNSLSENVKKLMLEEIKEKQDMSLDTDKPEFKVLLDEAIAIKSDREIKPPEEPVAIQNPSFEDGV